METRVVNNAQFLSTTSDNWSKQLCIVLEPWNWNENKSEHSRETLVNKLKQEQEQTYQPTLKWEHR
jgi:hypothetical protein